MYSGPTPANPFGGHTFDIFDVLEQAEAATPTSHDGGRLEHGDVEEQAAAAAPRPGPDLVVAEPEPQVVLPAEAIFVEPAPMPQPEPVPEPAEAVSDVILEPIVKPIIIGGDRDVVMEKKRGWWRR